MPQHSRAFDVANTILELCGQLPIAKVEDYNDRSATDKYQRQVVLFLDLIQRKIAVMFGKRDMWRRFQFQTSPNQKEYALPGQIAEGFKPNAFFDVTINSPTAGPLILKSYDWWRETYPMPDATPKGRPEYLILMPSDANSEATLMVWPLADAVYTIEGQSKYYPGKILSGSDPIALPEMYEHALVLTVCRYFETRLNEGREMDFAGIADESLAEILVDANGPAELMIEQQDFGFTIGCARYSDSTRDYNPATDTVGPYP